MVKNNDKIKSCNNEKWQGLMDAADLATQIIPPPETGAAARRRHTRMSLLARYPPRSTNATQYYPRSTNSTRTRLPSDNLDLGLSFESSQNSSPVPSHTLQRRAPNNDAPCIFNLMVSRDCIAPLMNTSWLLQNASGFKGETRDSPGVGKCSSKLSFSIALT